MGRNQHSKTQLDATTDASFVQTRTRRRSKQTSDDSQELKTISLFMLNLSNCRSLISGLPTPRLQREHVNCAQQLVRGRTFEANLLAEWA